MCSSALPLSARRRYRRTVSNSLTRNPFLPSLSIHSSKYIVIAVIESEKLCGYAIRRRDRSADYASPSERRSRSAQSVIARFWYTRYRSLARSRRVPWLTAGWCIIIDANSFGRSANYIWLGRGPLFASRRVPLAGGEIFVDFTKE